VLGYSFLFPLLYFLVHFSKEPSYKSASKVALTLVATGMWSIHFFAIGAVVTSLFSFLLLAGHIKTRAYRTLFTTAKTLAVAFAIVSLSSLYWVVPLVYYGDATLEAFDTAHFDAFATVRDPHVGAIGSVLTLRGFWLERHAWAESYVLPPEPNPYVFYTAFTLLFVVGVVGWMTLLREKSEVFVGSALAVVFTLSTIFAIGVSGYGVWYVTVWLFENSSLWSGFRDTQKWAGVLASIYALLFPLGLMHITNGMPRFKKAVLMLGLVLPFCIAPQMLFGLYGQVHTVWYPPSWSDVAEIVQETPECKMLVLPWHMYYAVSWNNGVLSSNPAGEAFPCAVFINRDPEIGTVGNAPNTSSIHSLVNETVTNNKLSPELAIDVFRGAGVTHILFSDDVQKSDIFSYPFLRSESLELVYESDGVFLYALKK
jgi:hypothetical protein